MARKKWSLGEKAICEIDLGSIFRKQPFGDCFPCTAVGGCGVPIRHSQLVNGLDSREQTRKRMQLNQFTLVEKHGLNKLQKKY